MTNTQKLAKNAFRKLRHLILSDDYSDKNLKEYNGILSNLYEENPPKISDFNSLGELDMISIFGFQLCKQKVMDIYHGSKVKSSEFNKLIIGVTTIEQSMSSVMDFDKFAMLLDHRIGNLSGEK